MRYRVVPRDTWRGNGRRGRAPPPVDQSLGQPPENMRDLLKQYDDVFPSELPYRLPPKRPVDHAIEVEGEPNLRLQAQLSEMLKRGFIEPSRPPYGAPILFIKKTHGCLRMVCDWRQLNRITVKNKACLPSIDDLFDTVQGGRYFTKPDLRAGYHQIRIQVKDIARTAINTPFGHFQFRVMGCGLTNAPATFQTLLNSILYPYPRTFVVGFLDDILIFSKSWDEHLQHAQTVSEALRKNQLYCKSSKCEFGLQEILFLGHRVNGRSILLDPTKTDAVRAWPPP